MSGVACNYEQITAIMNTSAFSHSYSYELTRYEKSSVAYISEEIFFRFVRARVLRARHRGRARRRRGCLGVLAGRRGVASSAVAVFVARRRVCLETRGKHEWALPGLLVWFRLYYA